MKQFYFNAAGVPMGDYSVLALAVMQGAADVSQRGGAGFTALHWSAVNNNTDAIRILLQYCELITIEDDFGRTPINLARERNNNEAVLLLQH